MKITLPVPLVFLLCSQIFTPPNAWAQCSNIAGEINLVQMPSFDGQKIRYKGVTIENLSEWDSFFEDISSKIGASGAGSGYELPARNGPHGWFVAGKKQEYYRYGDCIRLKIYNLTPEVQQLHITRKLALDKIAEEYRAPFTALAKKEVAEPVQQIQSSIAKISKPWITGITGSVKVTLSEEIIELKLLPASASEKLPTTYYLEPGPEKIHIYPNHWQ
ncbi:MAG: hypothetical protein HY402_06515 [Elusimicrobia bacterium]|nr:hypothetical protein [Elusimicrobiota bacterium]